MEVTELSAFRADPAGTVAALGYFDGLHLGHRRIIERAIHRARERGLRSVLFTFDEHPFVVLRPERPPLLLTTLAEKAVLARGLGIDALVWCHFTEAFSHLTPDEFAHLVLVDHLRVRVAITGPNYHFGHHAAGTPETLAHLGVARGFATEVVEPVMTDLGMVSSTRVRTLVLEGAIAEAGRLLGSDYLVHGRVEHGEGRGRTLGFPTANIAVPARKALPAHGVYAAWLKAGEHTHAAVVNLGLRPTFSGVAPVLEAHALDFSGDLYGREVDLYFVDRLRGEMKFPSADALVDRIHKDIERAGRVLRGDPHPPADFPAPPPAG